jgi:uncharacterized protein (DUF433 family)
MYRQKSVNPDKIPIAFETVSAHYNIVGRAKSGETYSSIAKDYGITRQRVEDIIKRYYSHPMSTVMG